MNPAIEHAQKLVHHAYKLLDGVLAQTDIGEAHGRIIATKAVLLIVSERLHDVAEHERLEDLRERFDDEQGAF